MKQNYIKNIINTIGKFKDLKRSGWLMSNINLPESDADHSFGVALLVMMFAPESLDKQKCMELALIHDLAEIYAGDITPQDNISKEYKDKMEREGALRLSKELNWPKLTDLVAEYNDNKTREARFVGIIDKLETLMTAKYYTINKRSSLDFLEEFSKYAKKNVSKYNDEELSEIKEIINSL